jgi:V8-like Glu-specific endopeptidase
VCRIANGRQVQSTATLIVSNRIAVTVAHAFYNEGTKSEELTPADCEYVVYDENDKIIDRVKISTIISRWVEENRYYDLTQDIALIKLERPPKGSAKPLRLETGPSDPGTPFEIIGFHIDIDGGQRRIFSEGTIAAKTGSEQEHNDTVLIHNASAVNETSGAPLIDKNNGFILGLHLGRTHAPDRETSLQFDARHNYNRAIIFDQQFVRDLHALMR